MRSCDLPILLSCVLLTGCAGGATCYPPAGSPSPTPSAVSAADGDRGALVQWGGTLVETRNLKDRTELEVIGYRLDSCGRPLTGSAPTGRFIIVRPGFLDTLDYGAGRRVTATGRITGIREGRLGEAAYRFPLVESYKVHLWPEERADDNYVRPWVTIGIGGGSGGGVYGGMGGGVGVVF